MTFLLITDKISWFHCHDIIDKISSTNKKVLLLDCVYEVKEEYEDYDEPSINHSVNVTANPEFEDYDQPADRSKILWDIYYRIMRL